MAIEDYAASTFRAAKDAAQYALFPLTKMAALMYYKDTHKANVAAGVATTAFYATLSGLFLGREMEGFDHIARMAMAAETGRNPDEIKFSDYYDSKNPIIQARLKLFTSENYQRYAVSALPMLPTLMENVTRELAPPGMRPKNEHVRDGETRWRDDRPKAKASAIEHFLDGWGFWDNAVYAGVATLWAHETFGIDKTFIYQGRKEMENNESLGLKIGANNIAALYNRMRTDAKLPMVDGKADREKMWPLYEKLANKMNSSESFGLPEIAYLMGMGKMEIFAKDSSGKELLDAAGHRVVDAQAFARAEAAIDHVSAVGLKGIIKEKQAENSQKPADKVKASHIFDSLGRAWMDLQFNTYRSMFSKPQKYQELISPRDPGEVPLSIS